jgi:hypothetical protein
MDNGASRARHDDHLLVQFCPNLDRDDGRSIRDQPRGAASYFVTDWIKASPVEAWAKSP